MEMTHLYLIIIGLIAAACGYLIWTLKSIFEEEKEERESLKEKARIWRQRFDEKKIGKAHAEKELEAAKKQLEKSKADLEECKIDKDMLLRACKRRKSEVEALKKQVERLKAKAQEAETLTAKLQSAYGRIGALTQQVNRLKGKKAEVEAVEVEKADLPKKCPEHLFDGFPKEIRQMAWEAMCSTNLENAEKAHEKKEYFTLSQAFRWFKTQQGVRFWLQWQKWHRNGADPNKMPPTDPNDPIYK